MFFVFPQGLLEFASEVIFLLAGKLCDVTTLNVKAHRSFFEQF
jgi:hypothetical protein